MTPEQIQKWIFDRCRPNGDCLEWSQAMHSGHPACRLPGHPTQSARRVLLEAMGKRVAGRLASCNCGNPRCMLPEHLVVLTRKQLQQRTAKETNFGARPSRRKKLAEARRKTAVLDMEKVQEMRERGLSSREAAAIYGVSQSCAHQALTGQTWNDYSNPFLGLTL